MSSLDTRSVDTTPPIRTDKVRLNMPLRDYGWLITIVAVTVAGWVAIRSDVKQQGEELKNVKAEQSDMRGVITKQSILLERIDERTATIQRQLK